MKVEVESTIRPVLGVEAARRFRRARWNWIAILDFLAIAGFVGFIHADLIFAPGQAIEFSTSDSLESRRVEAVLSIVGDLYLFDGQVFTASQISSGFSAYFDRKTQQKGRATLLIKLDARAPVSSLMQVCDDAQVAGFAAVHLAQVAPESEGTSISGF